MRARLLCVALLAALLTGADWARFRGPNGEGVSADKNVPVKWSPQNVLWKTPLTGRGHSSPIVVKGRVFLLGATDKDRLLACFDAGTGKELWARAAPGGRGRTHPKSSLASSTPCSDGEHVFCVFWDGKNVGLYAYDFAGKLAWHKDLGPFKSQHGPGFSPVVYDGKVFVNNDQDGSSALYAFAAKDGKSLWEVSRPAFRACYSTPFLYKKGSAGPELVVTSTAGVSGYNPADGSEVWKFNWGFTGMPLRTVASSVAADGVVVACAGDGSGARGMIAVKLGGKGDVTRTHLAWEKDRPRASPYVPCVVAHEGCLYAVTDQGDAVCYEAKGGKEVWRRPRATGPVSSSPVLIDGKVYAFDEKGVATVFAASPAGYKLLARNPLDELVYATPAVANGRLYVRGGKHLFCIGRPGRDAR
jgi:outer membrane protein assembly factor BamB